MTAYNVISPGSMVAGQPEDISVVLANLQAIQGIINGGIDDANINGAAALAISKLAGYPSDPLKYLRGDGTWQTAPPIVVGDELAYGQITTPVAVTATASPGTVLVSAPAVTFDGTTPVIAEFFCPDVYHSVSTVRSFIELQDDVGNSYGIVARTFLPTASKEAHIYGAKRFTPAAGAKVIRATAWSDVAGTLTIGAGGGGGAASDNPTFLRVLRVSPIPPSVAPGSFTAVYYGTSFPVSPADGQEAILVDSTTAPTYHWRFRYNAAAPTYKWEYIGGTPIVVEAEGNVGPTTLTGYGDAAGGTGPDLVIPRAGIYEIAIGAMIFNSDNNYGQHTYMSYNIGGTPAVDADSIMGGQVASRAAGMRAKRKTFASAPVTLACKYKGTPGFVQAQQRWIRATPIRVI